MKSDMPVAMKVLQGTLITGLLALLFSIQTLLEAEDNLPVCQTLDGVQRFPCRRQLQ